MKVNTLLFFGGMEGLFVPSFVVKNVTGYLMLASLISLTSFPPQNSRVASLILKTLTHTHTRTFLKYFCTLTPQTSSDIAWSFKQSHKWPTAPAFIISTFLLLYGRWNRSGFAIQECLDCENIHLHRFTQEWLQVVLKPQLLKTCSLANF